MNTLVKYEIITLWLCLLDEFSKLQKIHLNQEQEIMREKEREKYNAGICE